MNKLDNNKNINLTTTPENIIVETSNVVINVPTTGQDANEHNVVISDISDNGETIPITPVQESMPIETRVIEQKPETKTNEEIDLSWIVPKNIPKYTPEEIKNLTEKEKDEYRKKAKNAAKFGRYIEVKGCKNFYKISAWDFLPFFLGQIYSIIRLFIAYGDAKKTINFNRRLMTDIKGNFVVGVIFGLFLWPIIVICLFIFFPFIILDNSEVTYGWIALQQQGLQGMGEYFTKAVIPLFEPSRIAYTSLFLFLIGMANANTFVFYLLFKFNKKVLFELQKNHVREEVKRIKEESIILKSQDK